MKGFLKPAKNISDEVRMKFGNSRKLANKVIKLKLETTIKDLQQEEVYDYSELMRSMAFNSPA